MGSIHELVGDQLLLVVENVRGLRLQDAQNDENELLRWGPRIELSNKYPECRNKNIDT